jgi:uncharacterized protein
VLSIFTHSFSCCPVVVLLMCLCVCELCQVDGFGGAYYMDDANVPSLLSLPFLGLLDLSASRYDSLLKATNRNTSSNTSRTTMVNYDWASVYETTRPRLMNSSTNPFFFEGSDGEGIGGPHVGYGYAWPMAITMKALTSSDDDEVVYDKLLEYICTFIYF